MFAPEGCEHKFEGALLARAGRRRRPPRVAQTLLARVRLPVKIGDREISITTSVGIAAIPSRSAATHLEMLKQADLALYEAKEGGRDRYALRRMGETANIEAPASG